MWTDETIRELNSKLAAEMEKIARERNDLLRLAIVQLGKLEARIEELRQENLKLRAAQGPAVLQ